MAAAGTGDLGMSTTEQSLIPEANPVEPVEGVISIRLKRFIQTVGLIVLILGMPFALNFLCIVPLIALSGQDSDVIVYGVASLTLALLTVGVGGAAFLHADNSLHQKPSKPLRLPAFVLLVAIFVPLLLLGLFIQLGEIVAGFIFPFILIACALLPPLWAVTWMIPQPSAKAVAPAKEASPVEGPQLDVTQPSLTWRRGLLVFAGGATVSVFIAIVLEIVLPVIVLSLVNDMADAVTDRLRLLFHDLSNRDIAAVLTDRSFVYLFVQLAIIAPLAEELAKPLVTLPLLRRLNRQEAFWVGALAGAGFAALENVVYATSGLAIWAGILIVRALGGALHPLGSGLMAQGWWSVLRREPDSGKNWLKRFSIAFAIHAAWNGGSLLVISLGGAGLFGELPPEIGVLGLSAAGTTLAFLIILGLMALWIGRFYGHDRPLLSVEDEGKVEFASSDRALAVWALICLVAIVPIGIAGLKLWLR
jgi:RsiW-degrading membrane proteinase PrsW (M82 family)